MSNIKKIQRDSSGKKVSANDKLVFDYLNGYIDEGEDNHYRIHNNIVFGKSKGSEIFLFYKEDNNIYYRFAENNKKFTKKILPLIPKDKLTLYLFDRQIMLKKVRKNISEKLVTFDVLHSIISIYVNEEYYPIINNAGYDFIEILFNQIEVFDCVEELFSEEMTKTIDKILKPRDHPDYDWAYGMEVPTIPTPEPYLDLKPEHLKRAYKINCLIS